MPLHSVNNRERIDYLEYKHQVLTWGVSTSALVGVVIVAEIVSWRWGCLCEKVFSSVRKNAIEDELPVYEIPELDESGNWPKVRTRSIVPTVDDNPWEFDDTSEGSLQREDS